MATAHQTYEASESEAPAPYRLRTPAQFFPAPTMAAMQEFLERTGQRDIVLQMAHAARQREEAGLRCDSLAELAAVAALTPIHREGLGETAEQLKRVLREAAMLAADVGSKSPDTDVRSLCHRISPILARVAKALEARQVGAGAR